jgi:hypothetical protein
MDLIVHALGLIQRESLPVYLRNIDQRDPPFAHGEFAPSAIAILLMTSGLDYHLARLKYLRDVLPHKPPLPHTPYFNWSIGDSLPEKIDKLLHKRTEKRLKEQLIELTIMRDSVAHPKLYLVRRFMRPDYTSTPEIARLAGGEKHRSKALQRKLKRSERTKTLRLPLVPSWISYVDIVICVLVLNRFLNLLEERYGNPYGWVGGLSVLNIPKGFFKDWGDTTRRSIPLSDWTQAFFNSLATSDQQNAHKRLGTAVSRYISKRQVRLPKMSIKGSILKTIFELQNPPQPEFLRKPPPWKMVP